MTARKDKKEIRADKVRQQNRELMTSIVVHEDYMHAN